MGSTYGTWLPGSDLGWREYKHRKHVDGDYKTPPKDTCYRHNLHAKSKRSLKRPVVRLSQDAQNYACGIFVEVLCGQEIEVIAIAIDDHHFHTLARFPDSKPRHYIGLAKKTSAYKLAQAKYTDKGGVWATRSLCRPIIDRAHQVNTMRYILNHRDSGAAVWDFRGCEIPQERVPVAFIDEVV